MAADQRLAIADRATLQIGSDSPIFTAFPVGQLETIRGLEGSTGPSIPDERLKLPETIMLARW
jgi:hypothetical protein